MIDNNDKTMIMRMITVIMMIDDHDFNDDDCDHRR